MISFEAKVKVSLLAIGKLNIIILSIFVYPCICTYIRCPFVVLNVPLFKCDKILDFAEFRILFVALFYDE